MVNQITLPQAFMSLYPFTYHYFVLFSILNFHSGSFREVSIVVLIGIFLFTNEVVHLFINLMTIDILIFSENTAQVFCPYFL